MSDSSEPQRSHRARKTPIVIYPSSPPKTPESVETLFHAIRPEKVEANEQLLGDKIVTSQILYKPGILAVARIHFHGSRWQVNYEKDFWQIVDFPPKRQFCEWNRNFNPAWDHHVARTLPENGASFVYDSTYDFSADRLDELREDFVNFVSMNVVLEVEYNPYFKLDKKLDESEESFHARCLERARMDFNQETQTLEDTLQRLQDRMLQRLDREVREIGEEQLDSHAAYAEGMAKVIRKPSGINVQAEIDRHDSISTIESIRKELSEFETLRLAKRKEFEANLQHYASEREKDTLRLNRNNVTLRHFALMWLPYTEYVVQEQDSRKVVLYPTF